MAILSIENLEQIKNEIVGLKCRKCGHVFTYTGVNTCLYCDSNDLEVML